jgi:hypothetical protein
MVIVFCDYKKGNRLMKIFQLLDLLEKTESRVNQYWTYWSTVVLGVSSWLIARGKLCDIEIIVPVALGTSAFLTANFMALKSATKVAVSIRDEIRLSSSEVDEYFVSESMKQMLIKGDMRYRLNVTIYLHLIIDVALLILLTVCTATA